MKKDRLYGIDLWAVQVVPACYRRAFPVHLKSHRRYCSSLLHAALLYICAKCTIYYHAFAPDCMLI